MMTLKDAVSGANLAVWTTIAMVLFLGAFIAINAWTFSRPKDVVERWRRTPLDE